MVRDQLGQPGSQDSGLLPPILSGGEQLTVLCGDCSVGKCGDQLVRYRTWCGVPGGGGAGTVRPPIVQPPCCTVLVQV